MRQQFPPPHDIASLQRAARTLALDSAVREVPFARLRELAVPFLAVLKQVEPGDQDVDARPEAGLCLVSRIDGHTIDCAEPTDGLARSEPKEAFAARYAGQVLQFGLAEQKLKAADDPAKPRFGFRWFVPELLKHRRIWRDVLLASAAIQLMALATPIFTQIIIDKVIVHQTVSTLAVIAIALIVFTLFSAGMSWVRQYLVLHTGNRVDAVLGSQVFEHLFGLPPRYFDARPTGVLVARIQGVETIREFLSSAAVTLMLDVPFLLIFLAVMFYYSATLTSIALAVLGVMVALSLAIAPRLRSRLNQQFLLGARNQAFLTEYVAGMETVKSLQMEPQLGRRFGDYLASYLQAGFATRQLANSYNVVAHLLEQLLTLIILCFGAWIVMTQPGFTIGMLVAFQMFASRLSQPMLQLAGLWQQFQQAAIAVQRLGDVMDAPTEPCAVQPSRSGERHGRIEIRGLAFRYSLDRPFLYSDFGLTIEPGQCVVISGPSGSGKSTLAKLLQGFYRPEEGSILIDSHDVAHLSANELRENFGVVPQETVLFSGTVYENLLLANPGASFEEVIQACRMAEIHGVIEQLPQGYQTPIGEHGAGLSGGQKQRIAIARALLKRPRILIFDEATSSLDPAAAEQFARTVNRLKGRVTLIFITHHVPKGLDADRQVTLGGNEPRQPELRTAASLGGQL